MSALSIVAVGLSMAAVLAAAIMLVTVLAAARDRQFAHVFTLFVGLVAVWNLLIGLQALPGATSAVPGLLNALRFPSLMLPAACLHLALAWSNNTHRRWRTVLAAAYAVGGTLCLLQTQQLVYDGWITYSWGAAGRAGPMPGCGQRLPSRVWR